MKSLLYPDSLNIISGEDIEACMKDHEKLWNLSTSNFTEQALVEWGNYSTDLWNLL
jgi:hypothetical protein